MRNRPSLIVTGLLLTAAPVWAQQIRPPVGSTGTVDVGIRFTDVTGDQYRLQRYRDYGDGMIVERFRLDQRGEHWWLSGGADALGREDQRLFGEFRTDGKLKVSFTWDQIPLFISGDTRSLYTVPSAGELRLVDAIQGGIETGRFTLANVVGQSTPFGVTSYRHVATADLLYRATRELSLKAQFKQTDRLGRMPWGATFGFNDDVEVAAPVDTRTTDLTTGLDWGNRQATLRVSYDGSWFTNNVPTLVWDNPLKLTDSTASNNYSNGLGGSQGRAAMPPTNSVQGVTTAGSFRLPGSTRLTASVTAGQWRQNQPLLPVTINSAIPAAPLPRPTAEAEARTLAMTYGISSRPNQVLWFNVRYRYYDFDNRTPTFQAPLSVVFDQTAEPGEPTEALGRRRETIDLEASVSPVQFVALRVGYTRAKSDRTFRIFEHTEEDTYQASIDAFSKGAFTVRALYERGQRRGSHFDADLLAEVGERPEMRHYDVADRDSDRMTGLVQVSPHKSIAVSASATVGRDDYVGSGLGLRNSENRSYSLTAEITPGKRVGAAVFYTKDRYTALQNSRSISTLGVGQETDPKRDWATDSADRTEVIGASLDLLKLVPRTDVRLLYDSSKATTTYIYQVPANSTLVAPRPLPTIHNELRSASADVQVSLTRQVAVGVLYWYEDYFVDDFALSPATLNTLNPPGSLFLGYVFRPYTASSAALRLICTW